MLTYCYHSAIFVQLVVVEDHVRKDFFIVANTQQIVETDAVAEAFNIHVPILPGVSDCDSVVSDSALHVII